MTEQVQDTTIPAPREESAPPFRIEGDRQFHWAMRKMANSLAEIAAHKRAVAEMLAPYEERIAQVEDWAGNEENKLDESVRYFRGLVEEYMLRRRREDPKVMSLTSPWGTVSTRQNPPSVAYEDEDAAIEFLAKHAPEFVVEKTRRSLDKNALKQAADMVGGELVLSSGKLAGSPVPGVKVLPPAEPKPTVTVVPEADLLTDDEPMPEGDS